MDLRSVHPGEPPYQAAVELRHREFYESSGIAPEDVADSSEQASVHLVAIESEEVLGCGRLTIEGDKAQISQMVVCEGRRRQGIGSAILAALVDTATRLGVTHLHLIAHSEAVSFYARFGFVPVGEPFPSPRLGIPVIRMERSVLGSGAAQPKR